MDEYDLENLVRDPETLAKAIQSLHHRVTAMEKAGQASGAGHMHQGQDDLPGPAHPPGLCRAPACAGCVSAREIIVRQTVAATRQAIFGRLAQVAEQLHMIPEANRLGEAYLALEGASPGLEIAGLVLVP